MPMATRPATGGVYAAARQRTPRVNGSLQPFPPSNNGAPRVRSFAPVHDNASSQFSHGRHGSAPLPSSNKNHENSTKRLRHHPDCPLALAGAQSKRCHCLYKYPAAFHTSQHQKRRASKFTPHRVPRAPRIAPERKSRVRRPVPLDLIDDGVDRATVSNDSDIDDPSDVLPAETLGAHDGAPSTFPMEVEADADVDTDDDLDPYASSTLTLQPPNLAGELYPIKVSQGAAKRARKEGSNARRKRKRLHRNPPVPIAPLAMWPSPLHAAEQERPFDLSSYDLSLGSPWDPHAQPSELGPSFDTASPLFNTSGFLDQTPFDQNFPPLGTSPPRASTSPPEPLIRPACAAEESSSPALPQHTSALLPSQKHQDTVQPDQVMVTFQDGDGSTVCALMRDGMGVFGSDGEFEKVPQEDQSATESKPDSDQDGDTTDDMGAGGFTLHVPRMLVGSLASHSTRRSFPRTMRETSSPARSCSALGPDTDLSAGTVRRQDTSVSKDNVSTPKMGTFTASPHPQSAARRAIIASTPTSSTRIAQRNRRILNPAGSSKGHSTWSPEMTPTLSNMGVSPFRMGSALAYSPRSSSPSKGQLPDLDSAFETLRLAPAQAEGDRASLDLAEWIHI